MMKKYKLEVGYDKVKGDFKVKGNLPPELMNDVNQLVRKKVVDCREERKKNEICLPKFDV